MNRVSRDTLAGRVYLDLQNRARREGRGTQELLTLYVVERWLARLSASPYADQFVLKGGVLLAAFDARRPTVDADALARGIASDQESVLARVVDVARIPTDDGVAFATDTVAARTIRDQEHYTGTRVAMDAQLATATVRFRLDVNIGDPVTPAPQRIKLPSQRLGAAPIRVLGYPIETVLAEKIATAITLGEANTRLRDYADIYTLIGRHDLRHAAMRKALIATANFRGVKIEPLSLAIDNLAVIRRTDYLAYRASLGRDREHLPDDLHAVVQAVVAFADPLAKTAPEHMFWSSAAQCWITKQRT